MDLTSVKARLTHFGYTPVASDDAILSYIMGTVEISVKKLCNISEIPSDVDHIVIDKVVGEFLQLKKNSGADLGTINTDNVTDLTEGDVTIRTDKSATPGALLDVLILGLRTGRDDVLLKLRSLSW